VAKNNLAVFSEEFLKTRNQRAWSANFKMVWYLLLRPLRPELDGQLDEGMGCPALGIWVGFLKQPVLPVKHPPKITLPKKF
jgi:hypothetical protein